MQAATFTIHALVVLVLIWSPLHGNYHLLSIEHFQSAPDRFVLRSSAALTFKGIREKVIDLFDHEIRLQLDAGLAFRYKFPAKTDSAQFYFDASCPFPLVFKEHEAEFAFEPLNEKSAAIRAKMLMLNDFGSRHDFFNGGAYSSAPKDYQQVAGTFLSQYVSFRPIKKPKTNSLVVFCPFFAEGKEVFQLKLIAKSFKDNIRRVVSVKTDVIGRYYFKESVDVVYKGKTVLNFPFQNFNGTAWFNCTTNDKAAVTLTYRSQDKRVTAQYISFNFALAVISDLVIELENLTYTSFAIDVIIEGVDLQTPELKHFNGKEPSDHQTTDLVFEVSFALAVIGLFITIAIHYKCQTVLTEDVASEQGLASFRQITTNGDNLEQHRTETQGTGNSLITNNNAMGNGSFLHFPTLEPESINMSNSEIILLNQSES